MKAEDLKTKSEDELKKMLLDLRKEQMNLRFQKQNGGLNDTSAMRKARRTIARVKTFLTVAVSGGAAPKPAPKKKPAAKKTEKKAA